MRKRSHHRRRNPRRRHHHRRHRHAMLAMNRHRNPFRRHHRRRRNPSFGGYSTTELLYAGGGALVNGIITRAVPQMSFLAAYNTGVTGYALNIGVGAVGAYAIGKFNRQAGFGAWIGMIVAVSQRAISQMFGSGTAAATGGMSGDLDFDLGYYADGPFPFPQGAGGPYTRFPGTPYAASPEFASTSASAVRAGRAAAAAALPAAAATGAAAHPAASGMGLDRWTGAWS